MSLPTLSVPLELESKPNVLEFDSVLGAIRHKVASKCPIWTPNGYLEAFDLFVWGKKSLAY